MALAESNVDKYIIVKYPNLDDWSTTLEQKLESLLVDYITTNYDQSTVFYGKLRSYLWTLAQYGNDPLACREAVYSDLDYLLGQYFKRHELDVQTKYTNQDNGKYDIYIDIGVTDGQSYTHQTHHSINFDGSRLLRIMKYNNTGELIDERQFEVR